MSVCDYCHQVMNPETTATVILEVINHREAPQHNGKWTYCWDCWHQALVNAVENVLSAWPS